MGIRLSEITSGTRPVAVTRGGVTINVVYKLAARTIEGLDGVAEDGESEYALARSLQRLLVSWDLEADDGTLIPITADSLDREVPAPWLRAILDDIYGDDGLGEVVSNSDGS